MMSNVEVLKIVVDSDTKEELRKLAKNRYKGAGTVSEIVRIALREFLEEVKKESRGVRKEGG